MTQIRLILSFDHELSLGGTKSFAYNLFDPTDELIRLAGELDVPIVLFTDILCADRYAQWDADGFFAPYRRQLASALSHGHDVQLHIHPHWVTSSFVDGVYLPSTDFALSDFEASAAPNDVRGIVDRAYAFLAELCQKEDSDYRCIAYRAGGHNLSPATSSILSALYDNGIRIDSSIVKGFCFRSNISSVDQRGMPASANWTIPLDGPLWAQSSVGLYEVPIASSPRTPLNNVPFLVNRVLHRKRAHDPGGPSIHAAHTPLLQKLSRMFPSSAWALSFDDAAHSVKDLLDIFAHHIRTHADSEEIICAAVSHPKSMGDYERTLMRSFVNEARARFGSTLEFTTYRAVYDRMYGQPGRDRSGHTTHGADPSRPFRSGLKVASVGGDGEQSHSSA